MRFNSQSIPGAKLNFGWRRKTEAGLCQSHILTQCAAVTQIIKSIHQGRPIDLVTISLARAYEFEQLPERDNFELALSVYQEGVNYIVGYKMSG